MEVCEKARKQEKEREKILRKKGVLDRKEEKLQTNASEPGWLAPAPEAPPPTSVSDSEGPVEVEAGA